MSTLCKSSGAHLVNKQCLNKSGPAPVLCILYWSLAKPNNCKNFIYIYIYIYSWWGTALGDITWCRALSQIDNHGLG